MFGACIGLKGKPIGTETIVVDMGKITQGAGMVGYCHAARFKKGDLLRKKKRGLRSPWL